MTCLNKKTIINIQTDSLKFGLAIAVGQIFTNNNLNIRVIILSLVGFATYQLIFSNKIYNTEKLDIRKRVPIDDFFKFATMLFVSKFLITGKLNLDNKFIIDNINIVVALILYNAYISKYITAKLIKYNNNNNITFRDIMAINDSIKYSFVLISTGLLNDLAGVDKFGTEYIKLAAGYVTGLVTYDYVFS